MKRLHVHFSVEGVEQSVRFYSTLFAAKPTVIKTDDAKWMLDDPQGLAGEAFRTTGASTVHGDDLDLAPPRTSLRDCCTADTPDGGCCTP